MTLSRRKLLKGLGLSGLSLAVCVGTKMTLPIAQSESPDPTPEPTPEPTSKKGSRGSIKEIEAHIDDCCIPKATPKPSIDELVVDHLDHSLVSQETVNQVVKQGIEDTRADREQGLEELAKQITLVAEQQACEWEQKKHEWERRRDQERQMQYQSSQYHTRRYPQPDGPDGPDPHGFHYEEMGSIDTVLGQRFTTCQAPLFDINCFRDDSVRMLPNTYKEYFVRKVVTIVGESAWGPVVEDESVPCGYRVAYPTEMGLESEYTR